MRRIAWLALVVWLGQGLLGIPVSWAQTSPTPVPAAAPAAVTLPADQVTLEQLGLSATPLRGPYDSQRIFFSLPANWAVASALELYLSFDVITNRVGRANFGVLEVSVGDQLVTTLPITAVGRQTARVLLPAGLFAGHVDNRYSLLFFLNAGWSCDSDEDIQIALQPESYLVVTHAEAVPALDLSLFPWPFYQRSFITDTLTLVMPDQPSAGDVRAALTVAAGLGKLTSGNLALDVVPLADLTADQRASQNLAFVGQAAAFPELASLALPAPLGAAGLTAPGLGAEDGVVQLAHSPWNPAGTLLVVSGNSETGVLKAAQALGTGPLLTAGRQAALAVITAVPPVAVTSGEAMDYSLARLGANDWVTQGAGFDGFDVLFFVPADQQAATGATFTLSLTASALAANAQSGLTVLVNNQPVGSVRLDDPLIISNTVTMHLPASVFLPGQNRLSFASELLPDNACVDPRTQQLWLTVHADSHLYVPLRPRTLNPVTVADLETYPLFLAGRPGYDQLAFVVPPADPEAWALAAHLAFNLGNQTRPPVVQFQTAFADALPEALRTQADLIFVGRPSRLPALADLAADLPAPFPPGQDVAQERGLAVTYRLPEEVSIGYLELLVSPWNSERAILVVAGTSREGLGWAVQALAAGRLRSQLRGNWAVINGEQLAVGETRGLTTPEQLTSTAVPGLPTEALPTPTPLPTAEPGLTLTALAERPAWLLPAILGASAGIVLVIVVAAVLATRGRPRR